MRACEHDVRVRVRDPIISGEFIICFGSRSFCRCSAFLNTVSNLKLSRSLFCHTLQRVLLGGGGGPISGGLRRAPQVKVEEALVFRFKFEIIPGYFQ